MIKKIVCILFFLQPFILFADIIYLKNGKVLYGKITRQTLTKVEIVLPDKKQIILDKNEIKTIRYISELELQKQKELLEKKRKEAIRKKQEELKRIEEEKKLKEEEQKRLEEERRKLEEQQRLEELKRIEEEKKRKEEELKQLLELQKKQEEEQRKLQEEQKEIEKQLEIQQEEIKKHKLQYQIGGGIGSFNIPLNQFYKYYNFLTDFSQRNLNNYIQDLQIQMKSLPDWNWAGNLHLGFSYFYKDHELGFLTKGIYQKPEPKSIAIPDKSLIDTGSNEPQYESYSDNRFNQKKYHNVSSSIFFKFGTEEYINFFWNYIFPYFEIGYFFRNFEYNTRSNSTLITSKRNLFTNDFEFSSLILTESIINNHLKQNAIKIGIPFRFLMSFFFRIFIRISLFYFWKIRIRTIYSRNQYYK
ncbi:MAG: hypothetical protein KatS3mg129_2160 [Leptospiraceae bacterium]|nr:MAG: hypothetical protein KatS3mg129_2160 [Leptospiraceae bacterium]